MPTQGKYNNYYQGLYIAAGILQQVVDSLKQSCSKLSEEEIAKLSVQLMNCQSQAEGREVFPCTQDMVSRE